MNTAEDITEMTKEIDHLVVEKSHLFDSRVQVEATIMEACKHVSENTMKLNVVTKEKRLREIIVQLQKDNNILNYLFYPDTPPEQISERNTTIEEVETQLEELE